MTEFSLLALQISATMKRDLTKYQRAVHVGVKYPCSQCDYQATTKGSLTRHQRTVHEEVNTLAGNADNNFLRREIWMNIKEQSMK